MNKKYIVRLTDEERDELAAVIKKLKGTSQKVRRAQILLKADADGPDWTDERIAEAFGCRTQNGREASPALRRAKASRDAGRQKRETPPRREAARRRAGGEVIAMRLGTPPPGYANWTLRLLARKVVELEIVESISYETVRRTLKKTA